MEEATAEEVDNKGGKEAGGSGNAGWNGSGGKENLKIKVVLKAEFDVLVPKSKGLQASLMMRLAAAIAEAGMDVCMCVCMYVCMYTFFL